jgi:hypothetical protein
MVAPFLLYFSRKIIIPEQKFIILLCKCLVEISSEAWLNLFWEYINGKLFAVYGVGSGLGAEGVGKDWAKPGGGGGVRGDGA